MKRLIPLLALALAGCGAAKELQPAPGAKLPPAPYGATATPTATGRSETVAVTRSSRRCQRW